MTQIGEILKGQTTQLKHFRDENHKVPPRYNAEMVYFRLLEIMQELLHKRHSDRQLIQTDNVRIAVGQVALWFSWDDRFKGDVRKGLMIRGNVGTGKSLIAEALSKIIFELDILVPKFIHASELQDLYIRNDFDEIDIIKKRAYTIIDDVGVESVETKNYGNVKEPFIDVFDYRYREQKQTVITTNLAPSEIKELYGTRIIDRFRECMNDLVLDGDSFRK